MPRKKKPEQHVLSLEGMTFSTQAMAALLGITDRWLQMRVKEGQIPSLGRGRFDPAATTQAFLTLAKEGTEKKTGSASIDKLRDEKTLEIRMARARKERELIPLEEADGVLQEIVGDFNAYLSGLPAEITGVPSERHRLNEIIDRGRLRLADRQSKRLQTLRVGSEASEAEAED